MGFFNSMAKKILGDPTKGYSEGIDETRRYSEQARAELTPYRKFGDNMLANMTTFMNTPRTQVTPETIASNPAYQFRLGQGLDALQNSAIAKGGLLSGNAMRAISDYGQESASQEYDNALRLNEDLYNNQFSRLMQALGVGQQAATGSAGIDMQTGNQLAQLMPGRSEANMRATMNMHQVAKDINDSIAKWFGKK